jgi:tetratricopeptide (TPR) repeat protein
MSSIERLQQAIAAANAGQRAEARRILTQLVEEDERNEQAWLWLAGVVENPADVRVCLENVLELNPNNERAQRGLAWLDQQEKRQAEVGRSQAAIGAGERGPVVETFRPTQGAPSSRVSLDPPMPEVRVPATPPPAPPAPQPQLAQRVRPFETDDTPRSAEPDNPCPYCGAPTVLTQRRCLKCKNSLEIRDHPREKRSLALSILSALWMLDGALVVLASLGIFALAVLAYQAGNQPGTAQGSLAGGPVVLATIGFVVLLFGVFRISVGRALRARAAWAYYLAAALSVVGLLGTLLNSIGGRGVRQVLLAQGNAIPAQQAQAIMNAATGALLCAVVAQLAYIALVALSYRDFFGPMRRFVPIFARGEHIVNYNNGVAYKNRGMWYMAMREWEMAIEKARTNITYLHALGLAYAQVGRFDRARATLDRALEFEPNNPQLRESRQLVDQMAAKQS